MRLKVPKTERRKSSDTRGRRAVRRTLLILITAVLLGLAGFHIFDLVTAGEYPLLSAPENAVTGAVSPIQNGFSSVVNGVVNYLYKLKLRSTLELEYNAVKQENERLVYQAMLAEELQHKLSVYEKLFDEISQNEQMNPLVATVIGSDGGNYFSVFTINKGANDGIKDFMAVTMDGALIGYTYNVSATTSDIRTIIDNEASIAGLISSSVSRDRGMVRGTLGINGEAMCRMYYLPEDNLPRPGDLVVTSGIGMSFPKGIPIGTVRESTRGMESNKQYIVVEPLADFKHIEYVIVLRYQPEAEAVDDRSSGGQMILTPMEAILPIPTIQIGSDFYQLAPTQEPTPEPTETILDGSELPRTEAPIATPAPEGGGYEYQIPSGSLTDSSYGYTLAPTATPTPTPRPLDLTVEED